MADVQELREKRFKLWTQAKNFLDSHTDAEGLITDEDAATYEGMEKNIITLGNQIDRYERQREMDSQFEEDSRLITKPVFMSIEENPFDWGNGNTKKKKSRHYQTSNQYDNAFWKATRENFKVYDDYLREGLDSQGGFLLPSEFHNELITELTQENVLRQICTVIQTESQHKLDIVATRPAASWINEGAEITLSNETFAQISLNAYKLATGIKISNELLADSYYDLESHFVTEFGRALGNAEEDAFINGGGNNGVTNQPEGFLTTLNNAGTDTAITTTSARQLSFDDAIELVYALPRPYRKNAVFVMNDATLGILRRLKSDYSYYWTPSVVEGEPDRLCGYPVYTSNYFPAGTTSGTVSMAFGDFSRVIIADRATRVFKPLRELYALNDQSCFLMIERVDCRLVDTKAIKLLKIK